MIDVSPLTQLAQSQSPHPAEATRVVEPVQAAAAAKPAGGEAASIDASHTVNSPKTALSFRIDQESDQLIVSLIDEQGEVIRQIPSELILRLAERIDEILEQGRFGIDAVV